MQSNWYLEMEHGSSSDRSKSTFSLSDEDHTLANSRNRTRSLIVVVHDSGI